MSAHRIVWRHPDGRLSISEPVAGLEARHIEQMGKRADTGERVGEIDAATLPGREFRDAWTWDGGVRVPLRRAKAVALQAWWQQGQAVLRMLQERRAEIGALSDAGLLDDPATLTGLDDHIAQVRARLAALPLDVKAATDEGTLIAARPTWKRA